jgi:hypothetical protein
MATGDTPPRIPSRDRRKTRREGIPHVRGDDSNPAPPVTASQQTSRKRMAEHPTVMLRKSGRQHMSVTTAMHGLTAARHETQRDNSKSARERGYAQATGCLGWWWQVLGLQISANRPATCANARSGVILPRILRQVQGQAGASPWPIGSDASLWPPGVRTGARCRGIRRRRGSSPGSDAGSPRARPGRRDGAMDRKTRPARPRRTRWCRQPPSG